MTDHSSAQTFLWRRLRAPWAAFRSCGPLPPTTSSIAGMGAPGAPAPKLSNCRPAPAGGRQGGFTAIELAIVLAIIAGLIASSWQIVDYFAGIEKANIDAQRLAYVATGAQTYINANESAVETAAQTNGGAYEIPLSTIEASGDISPTFVDRTVYGGSYAVLVYRPAAGSLEMLVAETGGLTLSDTDCERVANKVGADGGCITAINPTIVTGAGDGWSVTLASYAPAGVDLAGGHPVASGFFTGGTLISPYWYRTAVPGHPEANTAQVDESMGGHNMIDGENYLMATGQTLATSAQPYGAVADGTIIPQPSCPPGYVPQISTAIQKAGDNGTGLAMTGEVANATNLANGTWQVNLLVQTQDGEDHVNSTYGAINVMTYCAAG